MNQRIEELAKLDRILSYLKMREQSICNTESAFTTLDDLMAIGYAIVLVADARSQVWYSTLED